MIFFFQDKDEHLELMDGVLVDLLKTKWEAFVKRRFYRQFVLFAIYFVISLFCFTLRPGPPLPVETTASPKNNITTNTTNSPNSAPLLNLTDLVGTVPTDVMINQSRRQKNYTQENGISKIDQSKTINIRNLYGENRKGVYENIGQSSHTPKTLKFLT